MRKELIVKSKTLTGTSDLTLLAPIRKGLVPSLDSVTYGTRAKRLMKTLTGGRASAHEYALIRPFADAVERVGVIHSFRVAVLESENMILLAVTFDGTWESYIRTLWEKVGTLLDVIFCNSEDYVSAFDHTFDEWTAWVRRVQVETNFFFSTSRSTVGDAHYLQGLEQLHRSPGNQATLAATRHRAEAPEKLAWNNARLNAPEAFRQGLQSLSVLFRLTDMYLPTPDYQGENDEGRYLTRAARDLLIELRRLYESRILYEEIPPILLNPRFKRQLDWLCPKPLPKALQGREVPELPDTTAQLPDWPKDDVQGGIVQGFEGATHGCLVLLAFDTSAAMGRFIGRHLAMVTSANASFGEGEIAMNMALTYEGFRTVGLSEEQLAEFPLEFRQGMEARASILGDLRTNHPRRWNLPTRNWPPDEARPKLAIELSTVHMIVQLRVQSESQETDIFHEAHPLFKTIQSLSHDDSAQAAIDVNILSVQPMQRYAGEDNTSRDHFGFADLKSQPFIEPDTDDTGTPVNDRFSNQIHLGEVLLGYSNEAEKNATGCPAGFGKVTDCVPLLRNGSYFVVRKLRQNVAHLNEAMARASMDTGLSEDLILAKMMGRKRNGDPLIKVTSGNSNNFNYEGDPQGALCPFHAHIRRANPRENRVSEFDKSSGEYEFKGGRRPHLMRRGMPYGRRYDPDHPDSPSNQEERGLIFMAYNASLAEQFEVVQRWVSGGNSSGGFSRHSDPFLGVPENQQKRHFRFEHEGASYSVVLDGADQWNVDRKPLVQLEWGIYAFTPSLSSLSRLRLVALSAGKAVQPPWSADEGDITVRRLLESGFTQNPAEAIAAWKSVLEDPESIENYKAASVWAAVRQKYDGILRTPYGVLVADKHLVMQVLRDPERRYSVAGYRERMNLSIGENYLGLDRREDGLYESASKSVNAAIGSITDLEAYELTFVQTGEALYRGTFDPNTFGYVALEKKVAEKLGGAWELNLDAKELSDRVLAKLCQHWFGLPRVMDLDRFEHPEEVKAAGIVQGAWRWDWREGEPPIYPPQFTAPSRFIFQPQPGEDVESYGCRYGKALTEGIGEFLAAHRRDKTVPKDLKGQPARLAKAILEAFPNSFEDVQVARTFVGALMGFLPTVDGNFRLTLNEWLRDGTFWSLRTKWQADPAANDFAKAQRLLGPALYQTMQLRPSPELVWRRATVSHQLGGLDIEPDETVVASLVSATHQCLEGQKTELFTIFGGNRAAAGAPTHACPGYSAAMGALFGMLAGLMSIADKVRPSPAPLSFTITAQ